MTQQTDSNWREVTSQAPAQARAPGYGAVLWARMFLISMQCLFLFPFLLFFLCRAAAAVEVISTSSTPPAAASSAVVGGAPVFQADIPTGYSATQGALRLPMAGIYLKRLPEGESALIVEVYRSTEGPAPDREAFLRDLEGGKGRLPSPSRRKAGGREFDVYDGLEVESFTRRISPLDPHSQSLGRTPPPPKLGWFDQRRFPQGGQAYKLFRCRKVGAWDLLSRYNRLREAGEDLFGFHMNTLGDRERGMVAACFGHAVLQEMLRGAPMPPLPMPGMSRLKAMAKEEWEHGASRVREREIVHLRPVPGGFFVLRLRAPKDSFSQELPAFDRFLAGFEPIPKGP